MASSGSISHTSFNFLSLAGHRLAQQAKGQRPGYEVILLCHSALEALTADLVLMSASASDQSNSHLAAMCRVLNRCEDDKVSTHLKLDIIALVFTADVMPNDREPFQSYLMLRRIRNALVHPRSEFIHQVSDQVWRDPKEGKLVAFLKSKDALPDNYSNGLPTWVLLMDRKPAIWAYRSAHSMFEWVRNLLPHSHAKNSFVTFLSSCPDPNRLT